MHWPPRPTHLFAPRKLLITMSDSTADNIGCYLSSDEVCGNLPEVEGWDPSDPGLFDK